MTDENPNPRVSNKVPPLFWILIVVLVVLVGFAFWRMNGHVQTPSGQYAAPTQQPSAATAPTPPQQSTVPNGPGPTSNAQGGNPADARQPPQ
jgi:hypothetical protein